MVRLPFFQDPELELKVVGIHSILKASCRRSPKPMRVALIGNFSPRKCGIATFTTDVLEKLSEYHPEIAMDVYPLDDRETPLEYTNIADVILRNEPEDYARVARSIN